MKSDNINSVDVIVELNNKISEQAEQIDRLEQKLGIWMKIAEKSQAKNKRLKEDIQRMEDTHREEGGEHVAMIAQRNALLHENQRLKELLIGSEPYSITHSIPILVKAIDHLMQDHSCDCHGYEVIETAKRSVMAWNVKAKGLLAAPPQKGQDNENTPTPTL